MSLKNLTRRATTRNGHSTWRLYTADGQELEAFTRFAEFADRYSPRTRKRYLEVVGRFLDYLIQAGVFDDPPPTTRRLNAAIDAFPTLLRDGSVLMARRITEAAAPSENDVWLAPTVLALDWTPMKRSSLSNTIAAVNHFLTLSDSLAGEEIERATLLGVAPIGTAGNLLEALRGTTKVSSHELTRMRQNSMLGSVAKVARGGLKRPRRLRGPTGEGQETTGQRDFPLQHLRALVDAATCWRDKALWLLLAASGIRTSEARNLLLDDVSPDEQTVYVEDPEGRRFKPPTSVLEQQRFKGRAIAATYLFPPLRQWFFEALEKYLNLEYVPTNDRFLFQYIESTRRGEPFVNASDSTIAKSFKAAAERAGVPKRADGQEYTPHSLRHLYGVYMLNDYPINPAQGRFGLPLTDVQMLMGHSSITNTQKYARAKRSRLMQKLQASDQAVLHLSPTELLKLPSTVQQALGGKRD